MVTAAAPVARFLPRIALGRLIDALRADGRRVIGPTLADGAVTYDEISDARQLPTGVAVETSPGRYRVLEGHDRTFDYTVGVTSWKRFVHPPSEAVTRSRRNGSHVVVENADARPERTAFFGVRPCELAALAIQDRVLRAGPVGEAADAARRDAALVIAVECAVASSTCFCASMGTGPGIDDGGADIVLSELDEGFVVRPISAAGQAIVEGLALDAAAAAMQRAAAQQVADLRMAMGAPVPTEGLPERLRAALDHPRWDAVAERCLACANCTLVCPTCFCTSVGVASDLDAASAATVRSWDSCFSLGFGRVAGDANFRPKTKDRYRQWLTHKFSTWWDQFGSSGCVGCGRCIAWCPVGIDVREELLAIAPPGAPAAPIPWPVSPTDGRAPAPLEALEPARHLPATVRAVRTETRDTSTLELAVSDARVLNVQPGQFVMVELPGFAIPPISISRIRPEGLDLTIRAVGPATAAITALTAGSEITLRGPLGRGWPVASAHGRDVVIVAGGIGLAPLRPLIDAVLAERPRFGAVRLYLGARTPADRLFVAEMNALAGRADLEVAEIVDRAGPEWLGRIGVVTQLFDQAAWDGSRATAFMCGPERMMEAAAATLAQRGVAPDRVWLTLERNMACGVGTCGHCQLGPFFICRDGPVFSLAELGTAFGRDGL